MEVCERGLCLWRCAISREGARGGCLKGFFLGQRLVVEREKGPIEPPLSLVDIYFNRSFLNLRINNRKCIIRTFY